MEIAILTLSLLLLLSAGLGVYLYRQGRAQLHASEAEAAAVTAELTAARIELATLTERLDNERLNAADKLKVFEAPEERLKKECENLANAIRGNKGKVLNEQHQEKLSVLLTPFRDQLEAFRKRVDEIHTEETNQSAKLRQQIHNLAQLSNQVSEDANNLVRAIKGDAKKQGDWGELMVERIFEASGLRKGEEYEAQVSMKDDEGNTVRPDFLVHLPGDKVVIVDSKVSLTAYERFCSAEDETARDKALKDHLKSVRSHVEGLQGKDYSSLLGNKSLDFVLMCIPLEPAYQLALQADAELIYELAGKKVVVTGPATLMLSLKLIAQMWRRENENRNAETIALQAGRMYDHVARIVDAMVDSRRKLDATSKSFDLVMSRLSDGKGNLLGRVEKLRKLGAKVSKQIDTSVMEPALERNALAEEEEPEEEDEES